MILERVAFLLRLSIYQFDGDDEHNRMQVKILS